MAYSISDLEQLSGISAHNIRIWERRYHALQPSRSAGNTRFYDDDQLKRLLNIASLYHAGHKISRACALDKAAMNTFLQEQIARTTPNESRYEYLITQIIANGIDYRENEVTELINQSFESFGVRDTYKFVLYPVLVRLGLMWQGESLCPSQEHFLSSVFRRKLFTAIDSAHPVKRSSSPWLLFLPEDEDHDIGLLFAAYLLKTTGHSVIYLGAKVPLPALKNTVDVNKPGDLLLFMTRIRPLADAQAYIDLLAATFPGRRIYVSGNRRLLTDVNFPAGAVWLEDLQDFESILHPEN